MIEIKKLLYATYLKEPTYSLFEGLLDIRKMGLEEIILLSESLSQELKERLAEHGINLKRIEGSGPFISRILETADREHASLIVAHLNREKRGFFRGHTARNLIKNTLSPLLLIPENGEGGSSSTKGLFDSVITIKKLEDVSRAMDRINGRYGRNAIHLALSLPVRRLDLDIRGVNAPLFVNPR